MIKSLLIILILISLSVSVVDAAPLSDMTGLKYTFPVKTDERTFTVEATGNLHVSNLNFDKNDKSITLDITSSIENNILEVVIPKSLISGDFKFYLDDTELFPKFTKGKNSIFVTIEFSALGDHEIKLQGTTYLDIFDISEKIDYEISNGLVDKIESNPSTNSLIFSLTDTEDAGQLSVKLSDDVILPFENNEFMVFVDGINSDYLIKDDTLNIQFNSNDNVITIIGTYVIPEFYEVAPLVLATSLIGLIVLKKYKKLFV
jgi:hypothetical protein